MTKPHVASLSDAISSAILERLSRLARTGGAGVLQTFESALLDDELKPEWLSANVIDTITDLGLEEVAAHIDQVLGVPNNDQIEAAVRLAQYLVRRASIAHQTSVLEDRIVRVASLCGITDHLDDTSNDVLKVQVDQPPHESRATTDSHPGRITVHVTELARSKVSPPLRLHLALAGEIDYTLRSELAAALVKATENPYLSIDVDMSDVSFIDSSGIAFLVQLKMYAESRSFFVNAPPVVRDVIAMLGVDEMMGTSDQESVRDIAGRLQG